MKGMLDPVFEEKVLGHAEVRQTFKASGVGTIAGSYVLDGTFERGCSVRVSRDGVVIFEGALASLKRFKDDVKEVRAGYECGLVFEKFNDVKEEDQVEAFKMVEVPRQAKSKIEKLGKLHFQTKEVDQCPRDIVWKLAVSGTSKHGKENNDEKEQY